MAFWNAPQACLWIATRDEVQVRELKENGTFAELAIETELAWDDVARDDIDDPEAFPALPGWIVNAQEELLGACVRGTIKLMGRPSSGGVSEEIPGPACATARFFCNHLDRGECLGPPGTPPGDYWTDLQVVPEDVRRVWPANRSDAASSSSSIKQGYDDDALVAEVAATVRSGEFKSVRAAALARKSDIQGHGTEDSKVRRIAEKVRKLVPRSSR